MEMHHWLGACVTFAGTAFLFLGALGIVRMPDLYNRMQAGTKATTLGNLLTLLGIGIIHPPWILKLILIGLFVLVTNPISSHALARAAYRSGVPLADVTVRDEYGEALAEKGIDP